MLGKYLLHADASPRVRAELIRAVAGHMPIVASGTVVAAGVVWFLLHDLVPSQKLLGWCAAIAALMVLRLLYYGYFRKRSRDDEAVLGSAPVFIILALISGCLWALLPPLFIEGDNAFVLISITIILIGMTAGALASESVFMPVFLAYTIPVMLSLSTSILVLGHSYDYLGILGYAFFLELIGFAIRSGRAQQKSFELRFENLALLEDLRLQKREAEQANLAKSRFLAAASHDLRQPLHALGLYLESLNLELDTERQRELAAKIGAANDSLGSLFQCLLDISRLDAGIVEAAAKDFALDDLLARLEDRYRPQAAQKGLGLEVERGGYFACSDPVLLERILDNLVSNALRYTECGQVRIAASGRGNRLAIEVRDSGPGIPEAETERIFDEFYQLENPARERTQGLGLGLAIVRRLCGLLHTPIELESKPGDGSRFVFYVDAGSETAVSPSSAQASFWTDPDAAVLVLDDDGKVREAMRELLINWGFDALCVDSEAQALEHLTRGFRPDLVVSDYRLGNGANGIDAAQAVFARLGHETPLILVTGDTSPERLRRAREDGYTLLHKPVNPAQLRMVINQKFAMTAAPGRVARLS